MSHGQSPHPFCQYLLNGWKYSLDDTPHEWSQCHTRWHSFAPRRLPLAKFLPPKWLIEFRINTDIFLKVCNSPVKKRGGYQDRRKTESVYIFLYNFLWWGDYLCLILDILFVCLFYDFIYTRYAPVASFYCSRRNRNFMMMMKAHVKEIVSCVFLFFFLSCLFFFMLLYVFPRLYTIYTSYAYGNT